MQLDFSAKTQRRRWGLQAKQTTHLLLSQIRATTPVFLRAGVADLPEKPGAGVGPMALGGRGRDAEDLRRLFDGQADEIAELDEFGLLLVVGGEPVQGIVDR